MGILKRKGRGSEGVTLIEMAMVIVIISVLVGGLGWFIVRAVDTWIFVNFRSDIVSQGSIAMDRMVREILQLKDDKSVFTATSNDFKFDDVDDNSIEYKVSGTTLLRNNYVIANGLQSLEFKYYDVNGNELSSPDVSPNSTDIWRVVVKMTFQKGNEQATLQSQSHPRNLFR